MTKAEKKAYDARRYLDQVARRIERTRRHVSPKSLFFVVAWASVFLFFTFMIVYETTNFFTSHNINPTLAPVFATFYELAALLIITASLTTPIGKVLRVIIFLCMSAGTLVFTVSPHLKGYQALQKEIATHSQILESSQREIDKLNDQIDIFLGREWLGRVRQAQDKKEEYLQKSLKARESLLALGDSFSHSVGMFLMIFLRVVCLVVALWSVKQLERRLSIAVKELSEAPEDEEDDSNQEPPTDPNPSPSRRRGRPGKVVSICNERARLRRETTRDPSSKLKRRKVSKRITKKIKDKLRQDLGIQV